MKTKSICVQITKKLGGLQIYNLLFESFPTSSKAQRVFLGGNVFSFFDQKSGEFFGEFLYCRIQFIFLFFGGKFTKISANLRKKLMSPTQQTPNNTICTVHSTD
jgi:hypothetical protein